MKTYSEILNKPKQLMSKADAGAVCAFRKNEILDELEDINIKLAAMSAKGRESLTWGDEATLTHLLAQLEEINQGWSYNT